MVIFPRQIASFASTNCNRRQIPASLGPAALQILNSSMSGTEHKCASNASPLAWINGKLAETMKFPRLGTCRCCFWTLQHLRAKQKLHVGLWVSCAKAWNGEILLLVETAHCCFVGADNQNWDKPSAPFLRQKRCWEASSAPWSALWSLACVGCLGVATFWSKSAEVYCAV